MAKNQSTVYLGFEDEPINDKHKSVINFMTNKNGGLPDWCSSEIAIPNCPLCGLNRPLILQLYAPLENSQFHRTFYIFGCLNPSCSISSKSWICVRQQLLERSPETETASAVSGKIKSVGKNITAAWCSGVDDWGEEPDENCNEENGNIIRNDNSRISDDDDESNSTENDSMASAFVNLNVNDDKNANCGAQGITVGAVGSTLATSSYAEIEGEESEVITIESPIIPERDLIALLKQTEAIPNNMESLVVNSFFIAVEEEHSNSQNSSYNAINDHIRDLMQEYQKKDEITRRSPDSPTASVDKDGIGETYEKEIPKHGDIMFHEFLSTIQKNPGQILRYSRDTFPLLIAPLAEPIPKCNYCGSECICEVQILPTLIPKLRFENNYSVPIEFGSVLIFTCIQSCWDTPDKMRLEAVVVQQEK